MAVLSLRSRSSSKWTLSTFLSSTFSFTCSEIRLDSKRHFVALVSSLFTNSSVTRFRRPGNSYLSAKCRYSRLISTGSEPGFVPLRMCLKDCIIVCSQRPFKPQISYSSARGSSAIADCSKIRRHWKYKLYASDRKCTNWYRRTFNYEQYTLSLQFHIVRTQIVLPLIFSLFFLWFPWLWAILYPMLIPMNMTMVQIGAHANSLVRKRILKKLKTFIHQ